MSVEALRFMASALLPTTAGVESRGGMVVVRPVCVLVMSGALNARLNVEMGPE